MMSIAFSLFIIGLAPSFTEEVTLTCGNTFQHTQVQCTCFNSGGNGIEWLINGDTLTTCFKSSSCIPDKTGYSFTTNSSGDLYFLTITSHSYSQCGVYECRDVFSSSNKQTVEISISATYLNMSWEPEEQIEPGNHTDGLFSVTSPCLFDVNVNDIIVQWFTVSNGIKTNYTPETYSTRFVTTSCKECKGVNATQIQPSFLHNESENSDKTKKEVSFALKLYDRENQSNYKDISFSGMYNISGINAETPNTTHQDTSPSITTTVTTQFTKQSTLNSNKIYIGIGAGVFVIVITIIIICVFMYFRRKERNRSKRVTILTTHEQVI